MRVLESKGSLKKNKHKRVQRIEVRDSKMPSFRLNSGDVSGFKLLFCLAIMYGLMSTLVYFVIHMKFIEPLGIDAPLDRFSEARAVEHVRVLSKEIDGRQVSINVYVQMIITQISKDP